jgi:DNA-binding response OmpR family regulator
MSPTRTLALSLDRSGTMRVVFVCPDLQRLSSYYEFLESEGFEVLVAFDVTTALDICRRSTRPVKAAVVLADVGGDSAAQGSDFVRGLSTAAPTTPCILLPPGSSPRDCAVLIRTAVRCTNAAYLGSS